MKKKSEVIQQQHVDNNSSNEDDMMSDVVEEQEQSTSAIALGRKWSSLKEDDVILHPVVENILQNTFKFTHMSPVQENAIPLMLKRTNSLVQACTGSGKTLAYLVPTMHHLLQYREESLKVNQWSDKFIYAVIICPTRELAKQVYSVAKLFTAQSNCPITTQLITGGDSFEETKTLVGNIAICTPGRLLDILSSNLIFPCDHIQVLILDEADRLLDMGFSQQLVQIIRTLKKGKTRSKLERPLVHGLFSATMNDVLMNDLVKIVGLDRNKNSLVSVQVDVSQDSKQATPMELTNYYLMCEQHERLAMLIALLQKQCQALPPNTNAKVIVYFLTCMEVDYFSKILQGLMLKNLIPNSNSDNHYTFYGLHGKMVTKRRTLTYESFMDVPKKLPADFRSLQVLLCTDIAARGLDLPNVELIIQYDAPTDPTQFVHRVGRTARMGKKGESIIFLSQHENDYVEYLNVKKIPVTQYDSSSITDEYKAEVFSQAKKVALQDRAILENGRESFMSFVRAYRDHQCEYIFRVRQLDFASLARAYMLTQIPKSMNELKKILPKEILAQVQPTALEKKKKRKDWRKTKVEKAEEKKKLANVKFIWDKELCSTNIENVPYKDERREKAKLVREQKVKEDPTLQIKKKKEEEEEEDIRNKSLSQKKKIVRESTLKSKKKKRLFQDMEWDQLIKESSAVKRLRQGKISSREYEELTNEDDLEEQIIAELGLTGKLGSNFVSSLSGSNGTSANNNNSNSTTSKKQIKKRKTKRK
jgi:ATP-dependent RNA helicase DDX55/SPB4